MRGERPILKPMINVSNLTKMYGARTAVNGLSFEAKKGEILGFLAAKGYAGHRLGRSTGPCWVRCYGSWAVQRCAERNRA